MHASILNPTRKWSCRNGRQSPAEARETLYGIIQALAERWPDRLRLRSPARGDQKDNLRPPLYRRALQRQKAGKVATAESGAHPWMKYCHIACGREIC